MKKRSVAIIFFACFTITTGWIWYHYYFPFQEFGRLGNIQFPEKSSVIEWKNDGWGLKGKFQISAPQIDSFIATNQLTGADSNSDFFVADRCIHNGDNQVQIRLEKKSGIVEIELQGPDHAGDKPCSVNKSP